MTKKSAASASGGLIADMKDAGIQPAACIVGEPTASGPAIAHKGV